MCTGSVWRILKLEFSNYSNGGAEMVRVLVADKQASVRYALKVLLSGQEGVVLVGEAITMDECERGVSALEPDILLLDWELPGMVGKSSLDQLRTIRDSLKIIAMSGLPGVRFHAVSAGVNAFIPKTEPPDRLLAVLNSYKTVNS
jgi:DNA-binding NarL/FixJ family response regulator